MFPIEQLPNELLVHIFRLMNPVDRLRVERVCTRWNILARIHSITFQEKMSLSGSSVGVGDIFENWTWRGSSR
uniref:F-box domain-containing protein n=1 Tax=Ditylenchus dipsaci TaxID=166011 RepID=A0A915ED68_9BILA